MAAKKRSPSRRSPSRAKRPEWSRLVFADLHVSAGTLDRCLDVLQCVETEALSRGISEVVFAGDFWEKRGVLSVRQVDSVLDVFERWNEKNLNLTLVPGNHDQVTVDGSVHGLRIFDQFPNIRVATEPVIDEALKLVFVPWIEREGEQQKVIQELANPQWTLFAHAEIAGATTNNKHKASGRVSVATLNQFRAVYTGHYHKRQKLGDGSWYIGSPYEKDFGERDYPHGIAVVSSHDIEPVWINLDHLPKHWRLSYPEDLERYSDPRLQDIVEVYADPDEQNTQAFQESLAALEAEDRRIIPKAARAKADEAPTFALSLNEGIEAYVEQELADHPVKGEDGESLRKLGAEILSMVPDAGSIAPMGRETRFLSLRVQDFCRIRGCVELDLDRKGTVLVKGPMGSGKTSLLDAMTWCLYNVTTPRKAGSSKASLKADDVVFDDAGLAEVSVCVSVDEGDPITITRSKKRGEGSRVRIEGCPTPDGISDQQDLIHHVVGLDYPLWRSCVYLGQGAVGNFVTEGDKSRKSLLSRAFRLNACEAAQKLVKRKLKELSEERFPLESRLSAIQVQLKSLQSMSFDAERSQWEARRKATIEESERIIQEAQGKVADLDDKLGQEPQWQDLYNQHSQHVEQLEKSVSNPPSAKVGRLHSDIGSAKAERARVESELNVFRKELNSLISGGVGVCSQCGQLLDSAQKEDRITDLEAQVSSKQSELKTCDVRLANFTMELGQLQVHKTDETTASRLKEARIQLGKCQQALNTFPRIKATRESLAKDWESARQVIERERAGVNPFEKKEQERAQKVTQLSSEVEGLGEKIAILTHDIERHRFWESGFGAKGVPVVVLRTALHELESHANRFLATLLQGRVYIQLEMLGDDLHIRLWDRLSPTAAPKERSHLQFSGGMRRCVELAFSPFALSELIFARTGVRVPLLCIDELTTHLDPATKPLICSSLHSMERETVLVIDHDPQVQGEFDVVLDVGLSSTGDVTVGRSL